MWMEIIEKRYFHKRKLRDKLTYSLSPLPRIFLVEFLDPLVLEALKDKNIDSQVFFNVESIEADGKMIHSFEGEPERCDYPIMITPYRGRRVVRNSDLGDGIG